MMSYYPYKPSEILSIVAAVLVGLSLVGHTYQNSHYRFWRVTFFMFYAGIIFTAGWIVRCVSVGYPDSMVVFMIQMILIYLAPPIYAAAEYNTLGRVMHYVPMHAVVDPNRVVYIFVSLGVIVEVLTAIGSSQIPQAQKDDDMNSYNQGMIFISAAAVLQAVVECGFVAMVGVVHNRYRKAKMLPRNLRTVFITLYGTSMLVFIRSVFRAVESFQLRGIVIGGHNSDSALLTHEWPVYALDALPMILFTYCLNILHPGKYLPSNSHQYLDFDGKNERMGPGWDDKTPWIMKLCDPLNIIGILSPRKRDEFYLKPREWPLVEKGFAAGNGSNICC